MSVNLEVEIAGRWDALALYRRLNSYHSYLVQAGRERWLVHAVTPGRHEEQLPDALDAIEHCLAERGIRAAPVRIDSSGEGAPGSSRPGTPDRTSTSRSCTARRRRRSRARSPRSRLRTRAVRW